MVLTQELLEKFPIEMRGDAKVLYSRLEGIWRITKGSRFLIVSRCILLLLPILLFGKCFLSLYFITLTFLSTFASLFRYERSKDKQIEELQKIVEQNHERWQSVLEIMSKIDPGYFKKAKFLLPYVGLS